MLNSYEGKALIRRKETPEITEEHDVIHWRVTGGEPGENLWAWKFKNESVVLHSGDTVVIPGSTAVME
jgi:hypothetical protein